MAARSSSAAIAVSSEHLALRGGVRLRLREPVVDGDLGLVDVEVVHLGRGLDHLLRERRPDDLAVVVGGRERQRHGVLLLAQEAVLHDDAVPEPADDLADLLVVCREDLVSVHVCLLPDRFAGPLPAAARQLTGMRRPSRPFTGS